MPIAINGDGTITGVSVGGLPDGIVDADMLAASAVTEAKLATDPQQGIAKAWVNFNGKAASIGSGRANGNVSSVADNGTGQYTVNFSNSFPDNDYAVAQFCRADSGGGMRVCVGRGTTGFATGSIQVEVRNGSNSNEDVEEVCLAFFR